VRNKLLPAAVAMIAICFMAQAFAYDATGFATYPVLKVTVFAGDTITQDMVVAIRAGHQMPLGNIATDIESVVGKTARRTLIANQPIPRNALREPFLVLQGKTVPLVFQSGTITITGIAQAMESGSAGELVSARNPDSGAVVHGIVQADGSLRAQ
jgi:flagellar basal body P-ring formation protein FlgA